MRNLRWAAIVGAVAMAAAGQAAAAITYLWTGSVASGIDVNGTFGPAGTDLAGSQFSAAFTFDPTLGTYGQFNPTDTALYGGQIYGTSSPGSVVLIVNNTSRAFNGDFFSGVHAGTTSVGYYFSTDVSASLDVDTLSLEAYRLPVGVLPTDLTAAYDGNPCASGACTGVYSIGPDINLVLLSPDHLTITPDPGSPTISVSVPEPSTWAMMVLGLLSVGAVLRGQRHGAFA